MLPSLTTPKVPVLLRKPPPAPPSRDGGLAADGGPPLGVAPRPGAAAGAACATCSGFNPAVTSAGTVPLAMALILTAVAGVSAAVPVAAPLACNRKAVRLV